MDPTKGGFLPAAWARELPEQTIIALREWGERHDFRDSEAEDSFERAIGSLQWALAVESAIERGEPT